MLQNFLYTSQNIYERAALSGADEDVGFLKKEQSEEWKARLESFDQDVAGVAEQAKAAGVPFAVVYLPNHVQAAMISMGEWPAVYDPYLLDRQLQNIVTRHGGSYIDMLPKFKSISDTGRYYYAVDGHPKPQWHAMVGDLLAQELAQKSLLTVGAENPSSFSSLKGQ